MSNKYQEIISKLDANLDASQVAYREAGNGIQLAYLPGWYVIDQLNQIIGIGKWSYVTEELTKVFEGQTPKGAFTTSYIARIRLIVSVDPQSFTSYYSDYGYGDGQDRNSAGKAHELAVKEAITDGLKRCAKNLGRSMGLALYDKSQQYVSEPEPAPRKAKPAKVEAVAETTTTVSVQSGDKYATAKIDDLHKLISATSRVVIKKGKATKDTLVEILEKEFGAKTKEDLSPDQARNFLTKLESLTQ